MRIAIFFFLSTIISFSALSVEDSLLVKKENNLSVLLDSLRNAKTDTDKKSINKEFKSEMEEVLNLEGSFNYKFTKLKSVGFIDSPDGALRIVNWNVEMEDNTHQYFCYLLYFDKKKKSIQLTELVDNSFMFPSQPDDVIGANEWYGALYYKIIPVDKGSKTLYTLLGWDGNTSGSNIKLIDVLYFNGSQAKLGSPIFKLKDKTVKRVFFEHSEKAIMSLRYEEQYKRIIYDHLSPESPGLEGFYSFYVPDMSYDAMILDNNKWVLKEDVIGINSPKGDGKTSIYAINERSGKIEKTEIKTKWINPEDGKLPGGSLEHKAVTPEDELKSEEKGTEPVKEKKIKDKRDPSQMNSTLGGGKKKKKRKH